MPGQAETFGPTTLSEVLNSDQRGLELESHSPHQGHLQTTIDPKQQTAD